MEKKELQALQEFYKGKKFIGFKWEGDLDYVYYSKLPMEEFLDKEITINEVYTLERGYYSVSGKESSGYCYPLEHVKKHLVLEKTEEDLFNDVFSVIKKVVQ